MHQKITKKSTETIELNIEADSADLIPLKRTVIENHRARIKAKGFRPGKAPDDIVEEEMGSNQLQAEVLEAAVNRFYGMAASNEKLKAYDQPEIKVEAWVPYTALTFRAVVPVVPDFKLPDLGKIKVPLKVDKVTDKDIDEVIERLRVQVADKVLVDRAIKNTDEVVIDFKGVDKSGKDIQGAEGKDYPLTIGSKTFIPGFEEKLIGAKTDEEMTFTVTFPKDYHAKSLANEKVTFTVNIKSVKEVTPAKLDDSFAKKLGPFENLKKLKEDIKNQLAEEKQQKAERDHREEVVGAVVDKVKFTPPAKLIDSVAHSIRQDFMQNLIQRGVTKQEYLESQGQTEEEFEKKEILPNAAKRAKTSLVLAEIAEKEEIRASKAELEKTHESMKERYKDSEEMVKTLDTPEARRDIANQILTEKTIDYLVNKVK